VGTNIYIARTTGTKNDKTTQDILDRIGKKRKRKRKRKRKKGKERKRKR